MGRGETRRVEWELCGRVAWGRRMRACELAVTTIGSDDSFMRPSHMHAVGTALCSIFTALRSSTPPVTLERCRSYSTRWRSSPTEKRRGMSSEATPNESDVIGR